jgi:hypothetical protein
MYGVTNLLHRVAKASTESDEKADEMFMAWALAEPAGRSGDRKADARPSKRRSKSKRRSRK